MGVTAQTVAYADGNNGVVYPITDRRLHDYITSGNSGIVHGCAITLNGGNKLHITAGWGIARGCIFTVTEQDINITMASTGTAIGYAFLRISTSASTAEFITATGATFSPDSLRHDDLTANDGVYEMAIAQYSVTTSTASNLEVIAPTVPAVGGGGDVMPKSGGEFTGNVQAYSIRRATKGLRNSTVTDALGAPVSTIELYYRRK